MAINPAVLNALGQMRIQLDAHVDAATQELVRSWARAWDEIVGEWQAALEAAFESGDGWPTWAQLQRLDRVQRATAVTREQLLQLSAITGVTVSASVPRVAADALDYEHRMVQAQLPPTTVGLNGVIDVTWNRVDPKAVAAIVRRTAGNITSKAVGITPAAEEAMKRTLIQGILFGRNPREQAREMLRRTEKAFNGGLDRAMVIARTEMLDAHRVAQWEADKANPKIVTTWIWSAVLDTRTCPSCWSQHGSVHPADEPGPYDHPQGRCARVPGTASWADLGFGNIPEPPSLLQPAEQTFRGLPDEQQLAIMGRSRLDALNDGTAQWADLSRRLENPDWRPSYGTTPVRVLQGAAG